MLWKHKYFFIYLGGKKTQTTSFIFKLISTLQEFCAYHIQVYGFKKKTF